MGHPVHCETDIDREGVGYRKKLKMYKERNKEKERERRYGLRGSRFCYWPIECVDRER